MCMSPPRKRIEISHLIGINWVDFHFKGNLIYPSTKKIDIDSS